ncbi:MAG: M13 family metallopeptidase [Bacteroidaceae bacterium]|nr:M13 family metallopeptidase [Bacteroidaceae bacterium]
MKTKTLATLVIAAFATMACTNNKTMESGIKLENLDTTAVAGDDFFRYACGGWMDSHPLTDEYSRFGSFDKLAEDNREQLRTLITGIAEAENAPGTVAQKIGDLYNMAMDSTARNERGIAPIQPVMDRIAALKKNSEVMPLVAELSRQGMGGFFHVYIDADIMNSKQNLVQLYQGGISLGEKEYYLDTDEATTAIREAFKKHIVNMFKLAGFDEAAATKKMEAVMKIETALADKSFSATEQRNPAANYHKMTMEELKAQFPGIDWENYFSILGINGLQELSVSQLEPIHEVARIVNEEPVENLIAYLQWHLLDGSANELSDAFADESFDFYGRTLSGRKEQQPRWKRAVEVVNGVLGEAVGQMYVEKYFPAEAKERMLTLVKNLQVALGQRIDAQDWMSDDTKKRAHEKLNSFIVKVGYPDKWKDYTGLVIDPAKTYSENLMAANEFFWNDMIARKYGKPVDNTEWHMTPQTVNAYYNPTTNEICFPAGILQYPFFDMNADDAFNYGAIGVVIGHEMTHGFDDQGRQFDKEGNLSDWWAPGDGDKFKAKTQVLVDHFNAIEVLPGLQANGELTLGENIADHGGIMVAYQAFKNATKDAPLPVKDGFTPEQRFFLAYSAVWAGNIRDEQIRVYTKSDPHSLGRWRVNGTLPHIDAWYEAFDITPEHKLYIPAEKRAQVW